MPQKKIFTHTSDLDLDTFLGPTFSIYKVEYGIFACNVRITLKHLETENFIRTEVNDLRSPEKREMLVSG